MRSLIAHLEESGQAVDTIVVFTADNGPEHYAYARDAKYDHWSAKPLRGLKRDIYEGGHRVPFLIKWPGVTQAGTVSKALVSQIDLFASLAKMLDFDLPDESAEDSHNLLPLLRGKKEVVRRTLVHNTRVDQYAIRQDDWLLIDDNNGYVSRRNSEWEAKHGYPTDDKSPVELYNLKVDIGQRRNLANEYPEKVDQLKTALKAIRDNGYSAPRLAK